MPELTLDWKRYKDAAVRVSTDGAVLLKNDNDTLPVGKDAKVALFGRMQGNYYKSGTGSGGMVNVSHVYDIREGLEEAGIKLDKERIDIYTEWEKTNPVDPGAGWGNEKWSQEEYRRFFDSVEEMRIKIGEIEEII